MRVIRLILSRGRTVPAVWAVLAIFVLILPVSADAALPWSDDFELYSSGLPLTNLWDGAAWTVSSNTVTVANIPYDVDHSTNSGHVVAGEEAVNTLDGGAVTYSNVWFDMYVKPTLMDYDSNTTIDASCSAMFYFTTDGYPAVQSGSSLKWEEVQLNASGRAITPITNGNWVRVTVFRNYSTDKWGLFVDGKLIRDSFSFINTSNTKHTKVAWSNEVYVDDIWISTNRPNGTTTNSHTVLTNDVDSDGLYDAWEIDYFASVTKQGGSDDYDNDGHSNAEEHQDGTSPINPADPAGNPETLAYREDFNDTTNGQLPGVVFWHGMTNSGVAMVQSTDTMEGTRALSLSNGNLSVVLNTATQNVWVQMYAKPAFIDDSGGAPTLVTGSVAGFYVNTGGVIVARSDSTWSNLTDGGIISTVPSNTWLGFATHLDYANYNWDLYVSTGAVYGAVMHKANLTPLLFDASATATNFSNVLVSTETPLYLDVVAISTGFETNDPGHTNVLAYDRIAGLEQSAAMPPYNYEGTNSTLKWDLGDDLKRQLEDGDRIKLYNTNGWNEYELSGGFWTKYTGSSMEITNLNIARGMGMKLVRGDGGDAVTFYPFSSYTNLNLVIYGTNAVVRGWNQMASPFYETRTVNASSMAWGLTNADVGDRIYLTEQYNKRLIYNGTIWRDGPNQATNVLTPGEEFWIYHKMDGSFDWNIETVP